MSARPGLCGGHRATGVPTAILQLALTSVGRVDFEEEREGFTTD
jgi:hypothetical protein